MIFSRRGRHLSNSLVFFILFCFCVCLGLISAQSQDGQPDQAMLERISRLKFDKIYPLYPGGERNAGEIASIINFGEGFSIHNVNGYAFGNPKPFKVQILPGAHSLALEVEKLKYRYFRFMAEGGHAYCIYSKLTSEERKTARFHDAFEIPLGIYDINESRFVDTAYEWAFRQGAAVVPMIISTKTKSYLEPGPFTIVKSLDNKPMELVAVAGSMTMDKYEEEIGKPDCHNMLFELGGSHFLLLNDNRVPFPNQMAILVKRDQWPYFPDSSRYYEIFTLEGHDLLTLGAAGKIGRKKLYGVSENGSAADLVGMQASDIEKLKGPVKGIAQAFLELQITGIQQIDLYFTHARDGVLAGEITAKDKNKAVHKIPVGASVR